MRCCRQLLLLYKLSVIKPPPMEANVRIYKDQLKNTNQEKEFLESHHSQSAEPTDIEKKYVYDVYDRIAPHFSHTRYKAWPKIEQFLAGLEEGSLVLDVGCGNGKYMGVNDKLWMVGTDRSQGLLTQAHEKSNDYELFAADSLRLPIRSESFDYFISIAVIHHFSNDSLRHQAISELMRVLRKGGQGLIYVWAFEQQQRKFTEQDIFVPWNLQYKFEPEEELQKKKEGVIKDQEVNEEKRTVVYKRYYHVFKKGELEALLEQHKELRMVDNFYDHANWCVVVEKL